MADTFEVVILTGLSGAGRSTAAHALEDLGFMVVDNLPPQLIKDTVSFIKSGNEVKRMAIVADARGGSLFSALEGAIDDVRPLVDRLTITFLEATDAALVRRFESSRRPHPLQGSETIVVGVQKERQLLQGLRDSADLIIDTSDRNVHDLRRAIDEAFDQQEAKLRISLISFGYKFGIPIDADMVADVRFLPNPFWVPQLRDLKGTDATVNDYVMSQPDAPKFLDTFTDLLHTVTDGYIREGKRYVTVAIGCTGGQHRSVAIVENLSARLVKSGVECYVHHRDKGRE